MKFYENAGANNAAEADRQEYMSQMLNDAISFRAAGLALDIPGLVWADIGAGSSSSLGEMVQSHNSTAHFFPFDFNEEAVEAQRAAGFEAHLGTATEIPLPDSTADVVHSRFLYSWLGLRDRTSAIEEALRITKGDGGSLIVVEYDWTVAGGPQPFQTLIDRTNSVLRMMNFDPSYGATMPSELETILLEHGFSNRDVNFATDRRIVQQALPQALPMIWVNLESLINGLQENGLDNEAGELLMLFKQAEAYAAQHPYEIMTFPDVVSCTAKILNPKRHRIIVQQLKNARQRAQEVVGPELSAPVGPSQLGAFMLSAPPAILQARQLRVIALENRGLIEPDGIQEDGTFIPAIDPPEVVAASKYFGTYDEDANMTACIGITEHPPGDVLFLPTMAKLHELLGGDSELWQSLPPIKDPRLKTYEASALAKSPFSKDPYATHKILLACVCEALVQGYDCAIVAIEEEVARLLVGRYGEEAFQRIGDANTIVELKGDGLREKGVRLVPFYVFMHSFFEKSLAHFLLRPQNSRSEPYVALLRAAQDFQNNFSLSAATNYQANNQLIIAADQA